MSPSESRVESAAARVCDTPARRIGILLVHELALFRAGLRKLVDEWPQFSVLGETSKGSQVLSVVSDVKPDIVLLSIGARDRDGDLHLVTQVMEAIGDGHVVALVDGADPDLRMQAVRRGAKGIVYMDAEPENLCRAMLKVHSGEMWLDHSLVTSLISDIYPKRSAGKGDSAGNGIGSLTEREREVATLVCRGLNNREIAKRLFVSETTIRHHLTSILSKLGATNRFELVILLYRHKFASPPQ